MKLSSLLKENITYEMISISKFATHVKTYCSEAYNAFNEIDRCLIRGLRRSAGINSNAYKIHKNGKRKLIDTDSRIDEFIEYYRINHYSHLPSRQKSIFCYTSIINTSATVSFGYGDPYIVFPIDGSKYFQSKHTDDFYTLHNRIFQKLIDKCKQDKKFEEKTIKDIIEYIEKHEEEYKKPATILNFNIYVIYNEIKEALELHFDGYSNLKDILKHNNRHEVIVETDNYYAIKAAEFIKNIALFYVSNKN